MHFPFHSLFKGMCKEYFGFWFECTYIYFPDCAPAHSQSSLPQRLTESNPESVKVHENLQKPFQQWNFVQRAERWQSIVSSLSPMMPNAAKRVKRCYSSGHFSEHTVPHQGSLSQQGHLHSFSPHGHLFVLPLPSLVWDVPGQFLES